MSTTSLEPIHLLLDGWILLDRGVHFYKKSSLPLFRKSFIFPRSYKWVRGGGCKYEKYTPLLLYEIFRIRVDNQRFFRLLNTFLIVGC